MNFLCVQWGFCIPPDEALKIEKSQYLEADDFACKILTAEGMNAEHEIQWRRKIRNKFISVFGKEYDVSNETTQNF